MMKKPKPISLKKFYWLQLFAWSAVLLFCAFSVCEELIPSISTFFIFASAAIGIVGAVALCLWLIYNFSHEKCDEMAQEHLNIAHTKAFSLLGSLLFILNCVFSIFYDSVTLPTVTLSFNAVSDICLGLYALMITLESAFFLIAERNPKDEERNE